MKIDLFTAGIRQQMKRVVFLIWLCMVATSCVRGAEEGSIDGNRMLADMAVLAADSMEGRAAGTPGNRKARDFIVRRFRELSLTNFGQFRQAFRLERNGGVIEGTNVLAYVQGSVNPDRFIVVTAHFDHLGVRDGQIYNGADDNASGTAALLALAAYFSENQSDHSMIFVALDGEEERIAGARAFVAEPPVERFRIAMNVNMDMISHADEEIYVAGTYHYPVLRPLVESAVTDAPVTVLFGHDGSDAPAGQDWTTQSDHLAFHEVGIPFLYFGVEDHPDYHQPSDDLDSVNPQFYLRAVETIRRVIVALDRDLAVLAGVEESRGDM